MRHRTSPLRWVLLRGLILLAALAAAPPACADDPGAERWNAYGQATFVFFRKHAFPARYSDLNGSPNSLAPERERSWSFSATAFLGLRLGDSGELYFAPEAVAQLPLSGLRGFGGSFQNGELQKFAGREPTIYRARLFFRRTWNLGGEAERVPSAPLELAGSAERRRFVLTAGNFSILDVFDRNAYAGDVRAQFMNWDFMTHAAYDYAADARGYTWGVAGEYYDGDWALRFGRFLGPREPNQLQLNYSIMKFHGDNLEIEHRHKLYGRPGSVRFLLYRNVALTGRFDEAINTFLADPSRNAANCTGFNYGSTNSAAPDLCWVRRPNVKWGAGLNLEQSIADRVGVFLRAMKSDGRTEVWAFSPADSSVSLGVLASGTRWGRAHDSAGIGYAENRASASHATYLAMGGVDAFVGDGGINYRPEKLLEVFYSLALRRSLWLTFDVQHVVNPAFNADRGPVTMYGVRMHAEF